MVGVEPGDENLRIHFYRDVQALSSAAAGAFLASAKAVLSERSRFVVALSGGSTPRPMYARLASEYRSALEWSRVHFFWTDERFVPPDDDESNYRMAREAMLGPLGIAETNVHRPDTSTSGPEESARRYQETLREFFGSDLPRFDWILLGMGEDGHVASLFPGSGALGETQRLVIAVTDSVKPPPVRLTMTLPVLNAAREIHFLVSGRRKQAVFSHIFAQESEDLPARRIRPTHGSVDWWVDYEAGNRA